jgi:cysteinyl-tRNA synthetase
MTDIYLFNTLDKQKEKFVPIDSQNNKVGIYSCGPTVYWNQHIGHMYAYVQWDVLVRFLRYSGYKVKWIMNITDVGHMDSDEDTGEDKMEKGAKREGVSVWEIADKYISQFDESLKLLNILTPDVLSRATEHIDDQITLAQKIEENGFTYETSMGLVFDTSKFAGYSDFAKLDLAKQKKRSDVASDPEKKNPWDFFLWVKDANHTMHWDSPWGTGYPGWHIECTAMSTKYLGEKFDIHTGGIDHIAVHHTNEIAQGYGAFGDKTANYWLHNAHLKGESGEKMSKSLGNFVTVQDLVAKGYDPLALRYLILSSHYRKGINFSWDALDSAAAGLKKLRQIVVSSKSGRSMLSDEKLRKTKKYTESFNENLGDDLNIPKALSIAWEVAKSNIPGEDKFDLLRSFDEVLGLGLDRLEKTTAEIPLDIQKLADEREALRKKGDYQGADKIRGEVLKHGYVIKDGAGGALITKLSDQST